MAAGSTYTPIATTTLSSDSTYTFSSIPSTYTDLRLIVKGGITNTGWDFRWRYNGDTAGNYSQTSMAGDGSSATSSRATNNTKITSGLGVDANTLNNILTVDFMNYANTSAYKTCIVRHGAAAGTYTGTSFVIGMWRSASAINSIYIYCGASNDGGANLSSGTTLTLYGITAA
jgi:hypothetical protein